MKKRYYLLIGFGLYAFLTYAGLVVAYNMQPDTQARVQPVAQSQAKVDTSPSVDLEKIWASVNNERQANNLPQLMRDPLLDKAAQAKCDDMVSKDYWSHNDPDGTTPWHFVTDQGIQYRTSGENLAYGFKSGDSVVTGWMNSPGHKANILNTTFTNVGYAQCEYSDKSKQGKFTLIVQFFTLPQ